MTRSRQPVGPAPLLRALALALAPLAAAGCATQRKPPTDHYARYRCADGKEIGVTFQQHGRRALLEAGGWSHLLPATASGSGARYSDGKLTLWTKGRDAFVEENGRTTYRDCTAVPAQ